MLKSKTTPKKLMKDGGYSVWEGKTMLDKSLFYYIQTPEEEEIYFFLNFVGTSILSHEFKHNGKMCLKDERIPESIKDFIRTIVLINEM